MKWPLGTSGATYLRYVTDTVHTEQYSDSQCTVQVYRFMHSCPEAAPDKPITFDLSLVEVVLEMKL